MAFLHQGLHVVNPDPGFHSTTETACGGTTLILITTHVTLGTRT
jgi:hypothetical protein